VQRDRDQLLADAQSAATAGAFSVVLECIPADIAAEITRSVPIPTIGIGAGVGCDGQVLVVSDMLGLTAGYIPKFARQYANLKEAITTAVVQFKTDVADGRFPGEQETLA